MLELSLIIFLLFMVVTSGISLVLILASAVVLLWVKVPYAPVPGNRVKQIIDLFELKAGHKFYELGCGDGRFVIEAAKRGAQAIGYEVSPWVYVRARLNAWLAGNQGKIILKNFYTANLAEADAVFCFLVDKVMPKVEDKLMAELKPGAKVVCYGFALPTWQPEKVIYLDPSNTRASKAFVYIK